MAYHHTPVVHTTGSVGFRVAHTLGDEVDLARLVRELPLEGVLAQCGTVIATALLLGLAIAVAVGVASRAIKVEQDLTIGFFERGLRVGDSLCCQCQRRIGVRDCSRFTCDLRVVDRLLRVGKCFGLALGGLPGGNFELFERLRVGLL